MPNFGLVVTPTFNPMSYEQYVQPFKDYAEIYNKISDAYDALEMEANKWEKLANSSIDTVQYQQYKKYADDLRLAASDLAENGLNHKTRSTLSNLRVCLVQTKRQYFYPEQLFLYLQLHKTKFYLQMLRFVHATHSRTFRLFHM